MASYPVDNFGSVVGENPTPYGILALWAVNGLSIVYWVAVCFIFLLLSRQKGLFCFICKKLFFDVKCTLMMILVQPRADLIIH